MMLSLLILIELGAVPIDECLEEMSILDVSKLDSKYHLGKREAEKVWPDLGEDLVHVDVDFALVN